MIIVIRPVIFLLKDFITIIEMIERYHFISRKRLLSSFIIFPIFLGLAYFSPSMLFSLMICFIAGGALYEFFLLIEKKYARPLNLIGVLGGVGITFSFSFGSVSYPVAILVLLLFLCFIHLLVSNLKNGTLIADSITIISHTIFGVLYISFLLGYFLLIRICFSEGQKLILLLFLATWAIDVGAAFSGTWIKSPISLAPISPKKNFAGPVGGIISCIIIITIYAHFMAIKELSLLHCIILGSLMGATGQVGDLTESLIKRVTSAKDSSQIIPGQGGLLDTFDSFCLTAPTFYYYLSLIWKG